MESWLIIGSRQYMTEKQEMQLPVQVILGLILKLMPGGTWLYRTLSRIHIKKCSRYRAIKVLQLGWIMNTEIIKRANLPKLTYDEREADYITGTSRHTRWRARKRGELQCVECAGVRVLYTIEMLLDWLNRRHYHRATKRKR